MTQPSSSTTACHGASAAPLRLPGDRRRIALLGMPNTGKSTFFNRLTGANAKIGNWPGVTIDLLSARLILNDHVAELVDLPGIYDLRGFSEDEQVVRQFLTNQPVDLIVMILNSVQIERQIQLAMQLRQLNVNMIVLLNMEDEARQLGIRIDTDKLAHTLQCPIQSISAKRGQGIKKAAELIGRRDQEPNRLLTLDDFDALPAIDLHDIKTLIGSSVDIPAVASSKVTERIDRLLLHPWLGIPLFLAILFLTFQLVYLLGTPVQDWMDAGQSWIKTSWLIPATAYLPPLLQSFLMDGLWDGLATVATFVPIIIIFFWFVAVLEDTGYFSRIAYLMDNAMSRLGLDGRSFVMVLMGFGCNVPALMGTRIMRSRGARLLSMLIIPFSLCSARLQVFVFMIGLLFAPRHAGMVLFSLYVLGILAAVLTALLFRNKYPSNEPFVLELPPYRLPTLRMLILRSWHEVRHFIVRATTFITAGVVLVWALTHLPWGVEVASSQSLAGIIGDWFQPVLAPLGIDAKLTIALIFGFVAKEIVVGSLAIIYGMNDAAVGNQLIHSIDWVQAYSFMLFTLIYTPCLSTLATLKSEAKSSRFMWVSLGWSLGLAWVCSFIFYQTARALGY